MAEMPVIRQEYCNGCGLCVSICSCNALVIVDKIVTVVEGRECNWCTHCEAVCPTAAIRCPYVIVIENSEGS